jgi:hypothetical protein
MIAAPRLDMWGLPLQVAYGAELPFEVHAILPFAAVGHILFAIWAFSMFGDERSSTVGFTTRITITNMIEVGAWACGRYRCSVLRCAVIRRHPAPASSTAPPDIAPRPRPPQAIRPVWELITFWSPDQAARRVLQRTALHHTIMLLVVVALLFLRLTFTFWVNVCKWAALEPGLRRFEAAAAAASLPP